VPRITGRQGVEVKLNNLAGEEAVRRVGQALYAGGEDIRAEAAHMITEGAVSGRNHVPSLPGELSVGITPSRPAPPTSARPNILVDLLKQLEFSPGTAAVGQANVLFSDTRTLAASATENLDLAGVLPMRSAPPSPPPSSSRSSSIAHAGNTNDVQLTRPATNGVPLFLAVATASQSARATCSCSPTATAWPSLARPATCSR
jgi:hypothetical protein